MYDLYHFMGLKVSINTQGLPNSSWQRFKDAVNKRYIKLDSNRTGRKLSVVNKLIHIVLPSLKKLYHNIISNVVSLLIIVFKTQARSVQPTSCFIFV